MANALFTKGKEHLLAGDIDLDADNIKTVLLDNADDDPNQGTDDALDDIASAARVATSANLASKTVTNGVFDAADVTFTSVTGDESESLVIYDDSGTESTSYLICEFDTASGLPVTPNGGDITVTWDSGANKIFAL